MAKRRGKKSLEKAVKGALGGKRDKLRLVPALMGAYVNGQKTLGVANRPDFVWVRLRGATSEVAQAFNDIVGEHWDLPILIKRDEFAHDRWRVHGRDIRAYEDWGGVSYLPPHAMSHSFGDPDQTGGVDPVWIFKRQFMPLLPRPEASGTMSLYLEPDFYYFEGQYHWWPGSGTTSLLGFVPTGASNAKFVTIYLDGELGIPQFIDGEEFNFGSYGPWGLSTDFGNLIALPNPSQGIPIAAVRLYTGSTSIGWGDIYDLRSPQQPLGTTGSHISIFDESVYKGAVEGINFIGDGLEVVVSGTYAHVFVTGTGGGGVGASGTLATYSLVGIPEPVDSITGAYWRTPGGTPYATGSINAFIDGISQVIGLEFQELHPESGTYQYLETPPTGTLHEVKFGVAINVTVGSEGATGSVGPQGPEGPTGTQGPQGIEGATGVQGPQGDIGTFGVFVTDEGAPIGTGTILDFIGEGVDASISGTVVRIFITGSAAEIYPPVTGTVVLYDEQSILGSVEKIVVEGDPAYAAITGAFGYISISGSVGPQGPEGATGSVGPQGAEGATGSAGAAGAEGATGSQGIQGIEGATGSQGIEGATGSQGIQGIEGATGSAGQTGPPGAEGATGSVGPQGVEGATGSQGIQGIEGATGSQGIEGATGSVGPQGIEGATGSVGPQGIEGATGSVGSQGIEGATGSIGPQGIEGATGSIGPQGIEGATGSVGPQGIEGATGSVGPQGIEGATGSVGPQGIEGATGSSGQTGPPGAEGATGSVGPQGIEGATGSQGIEGATGSQGIQGIEGATGSIGPQGIEGATGSVGPQGVEGATGSQGIEGATGSQGIQGIEGATGSVGPQGSEGATGSQGIQGIEGATGSVGPQGIEGATGSIGPQGIEGATGSQGIEGATGSVGPQGIEGATGSQGIQGIEGATGSVGPQGSEGATGSQGIQGIEGATGSVGPQGIEGATGSIGPQGIEGATGSQGIEGATGSIGPQGAEGATGSIGPQGIEGATGSVGPQGTGETIRAGKGVPLYSPTSEYWRTPEGGFITGSLSVAANGVWQLPTDDFVEQYAESGTFQFTSAPETGTVVSLTWGASSAGAGGGSIVLYDEQSLLGSIENIVIEGDTAYAAITGAFGYVSLSGSVGTQGADILEVQVFL